MMNKKKRVRILLRVSSNQQLEADGDLSVQRQLVTEYVNQHEDWVLDATEYFEGSNSGYKNAVQDRDVLQQALQDAEKRQYDILVAYKDDRIGRRMWEIGGYVMQLKSFGVDIYTVKDGCISPESNDIMGQMVLALRYGNAQKSSSDTGMRVKDTAQKLVQQGKFMGGKAPYGYTLVLSGELSKHGRALHELQIVPEQADVVKYIYELSLDKEFGSAKIAKELNKNVYYQKLAPKDVWKAGTITSILTNPIYAGYRAYKRREKLPDGRTKRLGHSEWILSEKPNLNIQIIDPDDWNLVQSRRKQRGKKYKKSTKNQRERTMSRNDGLLPLLDVTFCGYCGCKCTNGSKYHYWTIKKTGEKKSKKVPIYKCQNAWQGVPHDKNDQFKAEKLEKIVFVILADYIDKLQENHDIFDQITQNAREARKEQEKILLREQEQMEYIRKNIGELEDKIPEAMRGEYPISFDYLLSLIEMQKEKREKQEIIITELKAKMQETDVSFQEWESLRIQIPTWKDVFLHADNETKRVLVNKITDKILVKKEEIVIRFNFQPRMTGGFDVPQQGL